MTPVLSLNLSENQFLHMQHRDIDDTSPHIVAMKVKEDNVNNVHGQQEATKIVCSDNSKI